MTPPASKISLIDDLGINFSYNMMADSMKWSIINSNIRLKFSKSYTLSLNATWDPYIYELDKNGRPVAVDKLRILNGKGFGKLQSTGTSFSYSVNQETFKNCSEEKRRRVAIRRQRRPTSTCPMMAPSDEIPTKQPQGGVFSTRVASPWVNLTMMAT